MALAECHLLTAKNADSGQFRELHFHDESALDTRVVALVSFLPLQDPLVRSCTEPMFGCEIAERAS